MNNTAIQTPKQRARSAARLGLQPDSQRPTVYPFNSLNRYYFNRALSASSKPARYNSAYKKRSLTRNNSTHSSKAPRNLHTSKKTKKFKKPLINQNYLKKSNSRRFSPKNRYLELNFSHNLEKQDRLFFKGLTVPKKSQNLKNRNFRKTTIKFDNDAPPRQTQRKHLTVDHKPVLGADKLKIPAILMRKDPAPPNAHIYWKYPKQRKTAKNPYEQYYDKEKTSTCSIKFKERRKKILNDSEKFLRAKKRTMSPKFGDNIVDVVEELKELRKTGVERRQFERIVEGIEENDRRMMNQVKQWAKKEKMYRLMMGGAKRPLTKLNSWKKVLNFARDVQETKDLDRWEYLAKAK
jgi:hypothetical protein